MKLTRWIASGRAWSTVVVCVAGLAIAVPVDAQRGGRGQDRAELERRLRAQMGRMMQERLGLDEAQAEALSAVVREFDGRRRELARSEFAMRRRVEALMVEGGADQEEAQELLDRMVELRRQESSLFEEEQQALLEVLTPVQLLELHSLREQIGRRIRALRGGNDEQGRRRRGGGGDQAFRGHGNVDGVRGVGLSL